MSAVAPVVPADLVDAAHRAAAVRPLLVATDYDGVMGPLVRDPAQSRPLPGMVDSLRAMAAVPGVTVALVSGRYVDSLAAVTGVTEADGIVLIGSHGAESTHPGVREAMAGAALTPALVEQRVRLQEAVEQLVATEHPQARIEVKPAAVAVHTRGLSDDVAQAALEAALRLGRGFEGGLRAVPGKSVVELSVSHADKGSAVQALASLTGAQGVWYFGDDLTDEDVFRVLTGPNDVSVKVGAGETAARYRVADEPTVAAVFTLVEKTLNPR